MATGKTAEQALDEFKKALTLHLQGLIEDNLPLPTPSSRVEHISVP
jgi:predicted RNase H-like HicB family nuclease